jgi:hypothetical protein
MGIIQEIREEIQAAYKEPTSRDLTILALLMLIIPGLIGLYTLLWKGSDSGYYWIAAGVIICISRVIPPLFRRFYRLWLSFAVVLGYFVSKILLTLVFCLAVLPTGLIMRLIGKDPMERKLDPNASSYWIKRENQEDQTIERYEKQF